MIESKRDAGLMAQGANPNWVSEKPDRLITRAVKESNFQPSPSRAGLTPNRSRTDIAIFAEVIEHCLRPICL